MTRHRWLRAGVVTLVVVASCPTALAALGEVPTWARDADCDGHVDGGEWYGLGIGDYGWRPAVEGSSDCMAVFRFKDGMPVVLRCESEPRCRVLAKPRRPSRPSIRCPG
jgi:hypothetical protein